MYSPYEKDMRWLFGTNKIVLNSPYDFFFFCLQQHFIAEDFLLVRMCDNYFIKKNVFYTWVSELFTNYIKLFLSLHNFC